MLTLVRGSAALLLVLYGVFLGAVLTQYNPTVAVDVVARVSDWLTAQGVPEVFAEPERVEFGLNALMFSPVVLLLALVFPGHPWANWVVYSFVASGAVELWQGVFLPPRSAQMVDVVANTLGGLLGAALALPLTAALSRERRPSEPSSR